MSKEEIVFNPDGSVILGKFTYNEICRKLSENSPTLLYLINKKDKNIKNAIKYLEEKRIRNKAIIDVDVLKGILNEV